MKFAYFNHNATADGSIMNAEELAIPVDNFLGVEAESDSIVALYFKNLDNDPAAALPAEIVYFEVQSGKTKEACTDIATFLSKSKRRVLELGDGSNINQISPYIVGNAPAPFTVTAVNSGGTTITTIAKTQPFRFDIKSTNTNLDSSAEVGSTCEFTLTLVDGGGGGGTGDPVTFVRSAAITGNEADGTTLISTASGNVTNQATLADAGFDPDDAGADEITCEVKLTAPGGGSRTVSTTIGFTDA